MNETAGKILIEGNAAAAIGCMMAGVTVVAWYPITPSSSLCESLIDYMKKYRIDKETGKATFAIVQAEDEIAVARHGDRRRLGGRARDDGDRRPRHLADGRVRRASAYYAEIAGGDLRRPARRAVDRPADAHGAGRPPVRRRSSRTATPSTSCCFPSLGRGVLHDGAWRPSTSPSSSRRRSS